jgi:hypothetical protein
LGFNVLGLLNGRNGGLGKFFTPQEIERRNPLRLNYLLEAAPIIRSGATNTGKRYVTDRYDGCIRYWIDGFEQTEIGNTDLDFLPDSYLSAAELGAVEVYDAISAPAEFQATSHNGYPCTAVVIWTKWKLKIN